MMPYAQALKIVGYLVSETNYVPWMGADTTLSFFDDMFSSDPSFGLFRQFMLNLVSQAYAKVGVLSYHSGTIESNLNLADVSKHQRKLSLTTDLD